MMLSASITGHMAMQLSHAKKSPSLWHDMWRDWHRWTALERVAAGALGLGTLATAALYLVASAGMTP